MLCSVLPRCRCCADWLARHRGAVPGPACLQWLALSAQAGTMADSTRLCVLRGMCMHCIGDLPHIHRPDLQSNRIVGPNPACRGYSSSLFGGVGCEALGPGHWCVETCKRAHPCCIPLHPVASRRVYISCWIHLTVAPTGNAICLSVVDRRHRSGTSPAGHDRARQPLPSAACPGNKTGDRAKNRTTKTEGSPGPGYDRRWDSFATLLPSW